MNYYDSKYSGLEIDEAIDNLKSQWERQNDYIDELRRHIVPINDFGISLGFVRESRGNGSQDIMGSNAVQLIGEDAIIMKKDLQVVDGNFTMEHSNTTTSYTTFIKGNGNLALRIGG